MSLTVVGTVKIRPSCSQLLKENAERISVLFSAQLSEKPSQDDPSDGYVVYDVRLLAPSGAEKKISADFVTRLQVGYVYVHSFIPTCGRGANLGRFLKVQTDLG